MWQALITTHGVHSTKHHWLVGRRHRPLLCAAQAPPLLPYSLCGGCSVSLGAKHHVGYAAPARQPPRRGPGAGSTGKWQPRTGCRPWGAASWNSRPRQLCGGRRPRRGTVGVRYLNRRTPTMQAELESQPQQPCWPCCHLPLVLATSLGCVQQAPGAEFFVLGRVCLAPHPRFLWVPSF